MELPARCTGRTEFIRLSATRELTTKFKTTTYEGPILNITEIMNSTKIENKPLLQHILEESSSLPVGPNAQNQFLKTGLELKEIIHRARDLERYDSISEDFAILKQSLSYSGESLLAIGVIIVLIWKLWPKGGRPILIHNRHFSECFSRPQSPPEIAVRYSANAGRVFSVAQLRDFPPLDYPPTLQGQGDFRSTQSIG